MALRQPFPVSGTITGIDGNPGNKVKVIVYNLRTEQSQEYTTGTDGKYIVDLGDPSMTKDYANNDPVLIRVYKAGLIFKFAESLRRINIATGNIEQDLTLDFQVVKQPLDLDNKQIELSEHDPIRSAKKVTTQDPLTKYHSSDIARGDPEFHGYLDKDGNWYIVKYSRANGTRRFVKGNKDYSTNFNNRATLTYSLFSEVF